MSAIDCIAHVHIGNFGSFENIGDIGIYWPVYPNTSLEIVTEKKSDINVMLSPKSILLGGGSGEHKALQIINDSAILSFLFSSFVFKDTYLPEDFNKEKEPQLFEFFSKLNEVSDHYLNNGLEDVFHWGFDKSQWDFSSLASVDSKFKELGLYSKIACLEGYFEKVFLDVMGAIIIYKLPDEAIQDEKIKEIVVLFKKYKDQLLPYMNEDYENRLLDMFQIPEKMFGVNATILKQRGEKFKWGYTLEDWYNDREHYKSE